MPYTVHTLDGQAHTYPDPCYVRVNDAGRLTLYEGMAVFSPILAAYPAGQWTHYHVEPAPYETDAQASDDTDVTNIDAGIAEHWRTLVEMRHGQMV